MQFKMPLFDFLNRSEIEYDFKIHGITISKFDIAKCKNITYFFSRYERYQMGQCEWSLNINSKDMNEKNYQNYLRNSEILILVFKIFCNVSFFVKYRLCIASDKHAKINQPMKYNYKLNTKRHEIINLMQRNKAIGIPEFDLAKDNFPKILEMSNASDRTNNALKFVLNAYRNGFYWSDSFLQFMFALDSLYSSDGKKGMTNAVVTRCSKFLSNRQYCSEGDIRELYDIRSMIVHGKMPIDGLGESDLNIIACAKAEYIVMQSLKRIITEEIFKIYEGNPQKIQNYYGHLK
jgi:hypothetical protein